MSAVHSQSMNWVSPPGAKQDQSRLTSGIVQKVEFPNLYAAVPWDAVLFLVGFTIDKKILNPIPLIVQNVFFSFVIM